MGLISIVMPQMGQSIAEGTVTRWHREVGDRIGADDVLVEVESDKISFEVGSPAAGVLASRLAEEGDKREVGAVIGTLEVEGDGETQPVPKPACSRTIRRPESRYAEAGRIQDRSIETEDLPEINRDWLSPSVARVAVLNHVTVSELAAIKGTGSRGRVTRNDLFGYLAKRGEHDANGRKFKATLPSNHLGDLGEVVPMNSIRQTIADHMVQSIHTSAHVTMVHAVDTTHIVELREKVKDAFFRKHGVKMTYTGVLFYITAQVLREFPHINASVVGANIVLRRDVNIGCAVALDDQSLVVPVIREADRKSFPEIACELDRLIKLARQQGLSRRDVEGGTFTISNFGTFGSLYGTPIIHQPQVAILGMGAITKTFVPIDGKPAVRDILYLSLSFDHRVIDGALGGRFLNRLQATTESITADALGLGKLK